MTSHSCKTSIPGDERGGVDLSGTFQATAGYLCVCTRVCVLSYTHEVRWEDLPAFL